jgi:hypothetical protein
MRKRQTNESNDQKEEREEQKFEMIKQKINNKEYERHETEIWQLSVHPRQRSIPEMGETQSPLCVLHIDQKAAPFLQFTTGF